MLLAMAWALLVGCTQDDPLASLPEGFWVVGSARALAPTFEAARAWSGTNLAAAALPLATATAACPDTVLIGGATLEGGLKVVCEVPDTVAVLGKLAEGHAGAFVLPGPPGARGSGTLDVAENGSLSVQADLPFPASGSAWDLVLPAGEPPGPNVLPVEGALVHAHVRQHRVADVASLVGGSGEGGDVFMMQADLFAATVLSGSWEFAMWPAGEGGAVPQAALSIGVRSEEVAARAAAEYVSSLSARWPLAAQPQEVGGLPATCLGGLKLLPELAPCWAPARGSLVVGWNAASLGRALAPSSSSSEASGVVVDFKSFSAVDSALTQTFAPAGTSPPDDSYPWGRVHLSGARRDDRLELTLRADRR